MLGLSVARDVKRVFFREIVERFARAVESFGGVENLLAEFGFDEVGTSKIYARRFEYEFKPYFMEFVARKRAFFDVFPKPIVDLGEIADEFFRKRQSVADAGAFEEVPRVSGEVEQRSVHVEKDCFRCHFFSRR